MLDRKTKYTPEMIEKWYKGLQNGTLTKEGIQERYGVTKKELSRRLCAYRLQKEQ